MQEKETRVEFHDEATAGESTEVAETDKPYETPFEIEETKKSDLQEVEPMDKNPAREEITENLEEKETLRPASIEKNEHPQEFLSVSAAKETETEDNLENEAASPQDAEKNLEDTDESPLNAEISTESTNKSPDDAEESPRSAEKSPHVVKISPQSVEKSSLRLDQSPYRSVISPYRSESSGKPEEDDAPIEKRVKLSSVEIRIPNLKAQLNNIIKETEETVQAPPPVEDSEEVQEIGEDGQVYHTWRPKGRYELEHTEIMREEVVPISVSDVPEPPPVVQQQSEPQPEPDAAERDEQQQQQQQLGEGGPLIIQTHLPNGELGSPIEIPEGIPLLARILPPEEDSNREKIPLERLFTPATDSGEITPRKKKAYASSDFYAPDHPTIDDQLQLAQKISGSLGDQSNKTSRGQAMYEKRKQRSEKWVHTDAGQLVQQEYQEEFEAHSSETVSVNDSAPKSKPAMKLVMNPKGVQDHRTVEQHYEQLLQESTTSSSSFPAHFGPSVHIPPSPEIAKDIINDMQSPTGKGAALFAKRKKRMDKFIVDETNVQKTSAYQHSVVQNSSMEQSFSSFSSNSSSSSSSSSVQQQTVAAVATPGLTAPPGSKKRLQQERDLEQQKIMKDFLSKRESQFQMVKSPWEAALEGNPMAAFKQNTSMSSSSSYSSTSIIGQSGPAWLEGPKPVPVTAPLPTAGGGASLPNPPSLFARPAANGPATLPEISTILTTSNPTKSFKAGGINITPVLKLNPHFSSKPQPAKSPRSSSVGHKVPEKRLSTIPKAAQYPFPSYLSLASQQGGCVRSSSTSSIPRLAASSASNSYDDFDLKPGSPPVVCRPSHSQERSSLENDSAADQVQNNIYKDVKLRKIQSSSTSSSSNRAGPTAPAFKVAAAPAFKPAPGASPAFVPKASPSPASVSTIPENPASASPAFNPAATGSPAFNPAATGSPAFIPAATGSPAFNPAAIESQAQTNSTQFTPRATMNAGSGGQMSLADKRRSVNFNLAASGWGTYNEYYRPTSFAT